MANEIKGVGSLMDNNIPSQIDPDDLDAEVQLEIMDLGEPLVRNSDIEGSPEIEIIQEDDGGVTIDFDPQDERGSSDDFYANLAEEMPDRELAAIASELLDQFDANKASRQDWEETYANGLELL